MLDKIEGIVLNQIKYSDSSIIVNLYTNKFGRQSFIINGIRNKKTTSKINLFQPLSILNLEIKYNPKNQIQRIKETSPSVIFQSIPYHPVKNSVALFLTEVLLKTLKEEEENNTLYEFLVNSIQYLDLISEGISNFYLVFLIQYTKHLGFSPDINYTENCKYFDLINGFFEVNMPLHSNFTRQPITQDFYNLMKMNYEDIQHKKLTYNVRVYLLDVLLNYYKLHVVNFGELKTLNILKEIFNK